MMVFPNAKVNLGLKVLRKRNDGFHDIETVMIPIGLYEVLEIIVAETENTKMYVSGIDIRTHGNYYEPPAIQKKENSLISGLVMGSESKSLSLRMLSGEDLKQNLVMKVYELLKKDFGLPSVYIHLHKAIPVGAGLGGGSSDAAFAIKLFNELFELGLTDEKQMNYASMTGSDCAFFIRNTPAIATGRGEILSPLNLNLKDLFIYVVKPDFSVNTGYAYSLTKPSETGISLNDIVKMPLEDWKNNLKNDFEKPVFGIYPELSAIKNKLYASGAVYAAMSGSGPAVFGIFKNLPEAIDFPSEYFQWTGKL